MAAVATVTETHEVGDTLKQYFGTIALDSSYPTGGEAIDVSGNEQIDFLIARGGGTTATGAGYVYEWDAPNQKLLAFRTKDPGNAGGADIVLQQVANAVDLSALTAIPFTAWGQ